MLQGKPLFLQDAYKNIYGKVIYGKGFSLNILGASGGSVG